MLKQAYWQNYVNGKWCDGGAGRITVDNPATGAPLAEHALADEADIDRAVSAARQCHLSGALTEMRPVERGRMVRKIGDYLNEHAEEIAATLTLEAGKPLWESHLEVEGAARYFEYYGNQAETVEGRSIPLGADYFDFTVYEPYGVSAQVVPWNYPLEMAARSLSAGLATGNACVIKTPELDPISSYYIAKGCRGRRLSSRCGKHALWNWLPSWCSPCSAPGCGPNCVYRIGSNGDRNRDSSGTECGALCSRAGWQIRCHCLRRCRS